MRLQTRLIGFTLLMIPAGGCAAAFVVLWPKPVSPILAGIAMLGTFGAMLLFCSGAPPDIALQMQKAIFLGAVVFGVGYLALAFKYRHAAHAFSRSCSITAVMLGLGALGSYFVVRSSRQRQIDTKG